MNTLTISTETALNIIRDRFNLPETFRIVIASEPAASNAEEAHNIDSTAENTNKWIEVPNDWVHRYAPPSAEAFRQVEVEFADGHRQYAEPKHWSLSWSRNYPIPIVRFREASH